MKRTEDLQSQLSKLLHITLKNLRENSHELQNNFDIVNIMVSHIGYALEYASPPLKNDPELYLQRRSI